MDDLSVMAYEMRKDVLDMICRAGTGHIGGDFSVMEILTDLYFRQMNISPELMDDRDRDRFVLSKGHSVESYYAVLARKGFFDIEEVKARFSAFNSPYIGLPTRSLPPVHRPPSPCTPGSPSDPFSLPGPCPRRQEARGPGNRSSFQCLEAYCLDGLCTGN